MVMRIIVLKLLFACLCLTMTGHSQEVDLSYIEKDMAFADTSSQELSRLIEELGSYSGAMFEASNVSQFALQQRAVCVAVRGRIALKTCVDFARIYRNSQDSMIANFAWVELLWHFRIAEEQLDVFGDIVPALENVAVVAVVRDILKELREVLDRDEFTHHRSVWQNYDELNR